MVCPQTFHPCLAIIFLLFQFFCFSSNIEAYNDGFTVKLIRRNSHNAPSHLIKGSSNDQNIVQSPVGAYLDQHLMELSIGTPPVKIYGIADTGSDLTWTQCDPCINCYKQLNPIFNPQESSTYTNISCESQLCHELDTSMCSPQKLCNYGYGYGNPSAPSGTQGVLAQETVTLLSTDGNPISFKGVIFGCGQNNTGGFNDHEMGIIGLGRGKVSLISQIGDSIGGKKFSQCLVPFHTDVSVLGRMSFGKGSEVLGDGVVSTPMVVTGDKTLYLVTLLGISVEDTFLPFNSSSSGTVKKGNMFIDCGTPPTVLPTQLYDQVVDQVRKRVPLEPISNDPSLYFQLCYQTTTNLKGPMLTTHFEGADVVLTPTQIFISPKDGVFCLAMTNTSSDGGVYGNFAQTNYLIGFDLERQVVSFKPVDCTKN